MKTLVQKIPVPMAGLMLAFAATGNLVFSYGATYKNILGGISTIILGFLVIRIFTQTNDVLKSLNNPVVASVTPTFFMGIMLLSTYLKPYSSKLAFLIWLFGLSMHCLMIIWFTLKYMIHFDIKKVFPSYFIVYVGIVVGSITSPAYNLVSLGKGIFWFGSISYLVLLPIVLYRVFIVKQIPEPALPTLTIFAAPASLCLAGYISSFEHKNLILISLMAFLSIAMFIGVLLYLPKMLKTKFYPSYSAFTFPIAISAIAMKKLYGVLIDLGHNAGVLKYVIHGQEILTLLMVFYVFIKYLQFIFNTEQIALNPNTN